MTGARGGGWESGGGTVGRLEITREEGRMQRPEAANMRFGSPADVHGDCRVVFVARFASLRYLDERNFRSTLGCVHV